MSQLALSVVFGAENRGVDVFKHLGPKDLVRFGCASPRCRDLALGVLQNAEYVESFRGLPHFYNELFLAAVSLPKSKEDKYAVLKRVASLVAQKIGVRFRESGIAPFAYLHPVLSRICQMQKGTNAYDMQLPKIAEKCGLHDVADEIIFKGSKTPMCKALALPFLLKTRGGDFVSTELMRCQHYNEIFRVIAEAYRLGESAVAEDFYLQAQENGGSYSLVEPFDAMALVQFGSDDIRNHALQKMNLDNYTGVFAMLGALFSRNEALANQIIEEHSDQWDEADFRCLFLALYCEKKFELADEIYGALPFNLRESLAGWLLGISIRQKRWGFAKQLASVMLWLPVIDRIDSENLSTLFIELLDRGDSRSVSELIDSTEEMLMCNLDLVEVYKKVLTDIYKNREVIDSIHGKIRCLSSNLVLPYVRELIHAGADELLDELLPLVQLSVHHKNEIARLAIKERQDRCVFVLVKFLNNQILRGGSDRLIGLCIDIGLELIQFGREDLFAELTSRFHPPLHLLTDEIFDDFFEVASPDLIRAVMESAIDEESLKKIGTAYQVIQLHNRGFHDLAAEHYESIKDYLSPAEIRKLNNVEIRERVS